MTCIDDPIRRRADGSIDYAHYDRRARRLRSDDAHSALRSLGLGGRRRPR